MVKTYSLKVDGDKQLSTNFRVREFRCPDGTDRILIDDDLVDLLQKIRVHFARPVFIGSGYRTESYNRAIGGDPFSHHLKGMAADIDVGATVTLVDALLVSMYCELIGIQRIGCYIYTDGRSWVHVGSAITKKFWKQSKAGGPQTEVVTFIPVLRRQLIPTVRAEVKILQILLAAAGFYKLAVDGKFGPSTLRAVKAYQLAKGLKVDGIVGPMTWVTLLA